MLTGLGMGLGLVLASAASSAARPVDASCVLAKATTILGVGLLGFAVRAFAG